MNDCWVLSEAAADTFVEADRSHDDLVLLDAVLVPGVLISERLRNFVQELSHCVHDVVLAHLLEIDEHDAGVVVDVAVELELAVHGCVFRDSCYPFAGDVDAPEVFQAVADDGVNVKVDDLGELRQQSRIIDLQEIDIPAELVLDVDAVVELVLVADVDDADLLRSLEW